MRAAWATLAFSTLICSGVVPSRWFASKTSAPAGLESSCKVNELSVAAAGVLGAEDGASDGEAELVAGAGRGKCVAAEAVASGTSRCRVPRTTQLASASNSTPPTASATFPRDPKPRSLTLGVEWGASGGSARVASLLEWLSAPKPFRRGPERVNTALASVPVSDG